MSPSEHRNRVKIDSPLALSILLALWALLMWLAFPRPALWGAAHLALAPLTLAAVRGESLKRVGWLSYLFGVIWALLAVLWMRHVTMGGYIALAFYMGAFPAAFVLGVRLIKRRLHLPLVLAVPLVWVPLEYLRGAWLWDGFPWFLLGQSQPTSMIQIADVVGTYGVSFVVAMTGGLIVDLLTQPVFRPGGRIGKTVRLSLTIWLVTMTGTVGYGIWRTGYEPTGPTLRVAVVQTDVPQSNKIRPTDEQEIADFNNLIAMTREAAGAEPDLIVWPETVSPRAINDETVRVAAGFCRRLREMPPTDQDQLRALEYWCACLLYRQSIERIAAEVGTYLIAGAHAYTEWTDGPGNRYNSAYLLDPGGALAGRFDKIHRVPFGEYLPFKGWPVLSSLMQALSPYDYDYSLAKGKVYTTFDLALGEENWRVGTPICFEDVVDYVCRRMTYRSGKQVDLLVNLTNDGWYAGTAQNSQHMQIARLRCVENRVPMVRSVNRGISGFIDSAGRIIKRVEVGGKHEKVAGVAVAELKADPRRTVFGRLGNTFAGLCTLALIGMLLLSVAVGRQGKV
jgi:apolipoprotein N-acyltransferase